MSSLDTRLSACFKAYDIRGRVPEEIDDELAFRIGWAFARYLDAKRIVIGGDVRDSTEALMRAAALGMEAAGAKVSSIGLCGTEEIYFSTFHYGFDGGVMVTASHNPQGYNGLKLVREEARPVSGDHGLGDIRALCASAPALDASRAPVIEMLDHRDALVEHLLSYVDVARLKPLKIVANAGNGTAGPLMDAVCAKLPFEIVRVHFEPDATFPNGIPNPLLPENRAATANVVRETNADFGIAWDGDFDRCFFFDETGRFVEGYYLVGLLAEVMLDKQPGQKIVHDPRLYWHTGKLVREHGGEPVKSKSGHSFMKHVMREHNAVYGGEISAHHYFRKFNYCDSGMLPWLMIALLLSETGERLSSFVAEAGQAFPCSDELNFRVGDPDELLAALQAELEEEAVAVEYVDGLGMNFADWRFNVRKSNTEPLVRLNVEVRGNRERLEERIAFLKSRIASYSG